MTTTVNLSLTDYMKVTALVNDGTTDEPSRFEVVLKGTGGERNETRD